MVEGVVVNWLPTTGYRLPADYYRLLPTKMTGPRNCRRW